MGALRGNGHRARLFRGGVALAGPAELCGRFEIFFDLARFNDDFEDLAREEPADPAFAEPVRSNYSSIVTHVGADAL